MASCSIDLKVGETLSLDGGRVLLTLVEKSGQRARLALIAPKSVTWSKGTSQVAIETVRQGCLTRKP